MINSKSSRVTLLICVLLIGATVAVYWPVWTFDFLSYDDGEYVNKNPWVMHGLTSHNIAWAFKTGWANNWHPLTWLSLMLDVELFGPNAGGYHLVNLLLHIANVLLLFLVLKRITGTVWRSAFVAGLFAIHPLHVESVAWIAERKDVLSGLFFFLTIWAYARYVDCRKQEPKESKKEPEGAEVTIGGGSLTWFAASLFLFACGLMSKPMLVTLPFVLLLLDVWPLCRAPLLPFSSALLPQWLGLIREKLPFLGLSVVSCVATMAAQTIMEGLPLLTRLANGMLACVAYLKQTFWPTHLAIFYPYPRGFPALEVIASVILLMLITIVCFRSIRQAPYASVGWLWYLGMLVPVLGIVQVGSQARADRYTYLPAIGIFIALVWAVTALAGRRKELISLAGTTGAVVFAMLGVAAHQQVQCWRNSETVFLHATQVTEGNFVALGALGMSELWRGDYGKAMNHLKAALAAAKGGSAEKGINYYMGVALQMQGKPVEALPWLQQAQVSGALQPDLDYRLGVSLVEVGRTAEAELPLRRALAARPYNPDFQMAMAKLRLHQGNAAEAEAIYKQVIAEYPQAPQPYKAYADFLVRVKRPAEAAEQYATVIRFQPNLELYLAYASALIESGKRAEGTQQLKEILKASPNNATVNFQIADLLSRSGEPSDAVACYETGLKAAPEQIDALNNLAWLLATSPDDKVRNGNRAVELAERACEITKWKEAFLLGTLAAAYAEAGRFTNAVPIAEKARDLARANNFDQVAKRNEELLELYRTGTPYRER